MDLVKTHNLLPEGVSTTDARSIEFATEVINCLPYEPNDEQMELLAAFAHLMLYGHPQAVMLVNGYAGTGKTSMIGGIVKALDPCRFARPLKSHARPLVALPHFSQAGTHVPPRPRTLETKLASEPDCISPLACPPAAYPLLG